MTNKFASLMGCDKSIVAAVHTLPLPGSPYYDRDGGMKKIITRAKSDARILAYEGVQAFLFTNEADLPYKFRVEKETIAAFSAVVAEVMQDYKIPFGINVLVDVYAAFCIAHATGASFIRGLFSGVYTSDNGIIENQGSNTFQARSNLGTDMPFFIHNLNSPIGQPYVQRSGEEECKSILFHIPVDGFTLPSFDTETFPKVKKLAPDMPLLVGTGTNINNLEVLLNVCDGTIVATCLRSEGKLLNPVDPVRTHDFMTLYRKITG